MFLDTAHMENEWSPFIHFRVSEMEGIFIFSINLNFTFSEQPFDHSGLTENTTDKNSAHLKNIKHGLDPRKENCKIFTHF